MRYISNSEVNSWNTCTRKYFYEYVLDLEPVESSEPINNGILIHAALENYYIGKSEGLDEESCRTMALQVFMDAMSLPTADVVKLGKLHGLVQKYFDAYMADDERYEILAVETKYRFDISEDFALVGTIDLLLRDIPTGKIIPVDHKSSYNFWSVEQLTMDAQFMKYIILLRGIGLDVDTFMVNVLRTREVKTGDIFRREFVKPSEKRLQLALTQHVRVAEQILEFHRNGAQKKDTIPALQKMVCSNCPFLALCDSDIEGAPINYMIEQEYKSRSYGYHIPEETSA